MIKELQKTQRNREVLPVLLSIWDSAVQATHDFLTPQDILALRPQVEQALCQVERLFCWEDSDGTPLAFLGVEQGKIEMLFVDDAARGRGIGKHLILYALNELGATLVDVNEQNTQGEGFYRHLGFEKIGRSPLDDQGNPFPILHLRYNPPQAQ